MFTFSLGNSMIFGSVFLSVTAIFSVRAIFWQGRLAAGVLGECWSQGAGCGGPGSIRAVFCSIIVFCPSRWLLLMSMAMVSSSAGSGMMVRDWPLMCSILFSNGCPHCPESSVFFCGRCFRSRGCPWWFR